MKELFENSVLRDMYEQKNEEFSYFIIKNSREYKKNEENKKIEIELEGFTNGKSIENIVFAYLIRKSLINNNGIFEKYIKTQKSHYLFYENFKVQKLHLKINSNCQVSD